MDSAPFATAEALLGCSQQNLKQGLNKANAFDPSQHSTANRQSEVNNFHYPLSKALKQF